MSDERGRNVKRYSLAPLTLEQALKQAMDAGKPKDPKASKKRPKGKRKAKTGKG